MTAARAMKPRPALMFIWKLPAEARLREEPAMPAISPATSIARYRILITSMPTVPAADGISPLGPEPETPPRAVEHVREGHHHQQREVQVGRGGEQDRADHRELGEHRHPERLDRRRGVELGVPRQDAEVQEVGDPERADVDHDAAR